MPEDENVTRKLRAILSADVKGYSLLMSDDEAFTVKTLKEYRTAMSELIEQHTGRVVDDPGDNLLAEFPSAVDAVQCAVEMQKALKEKNKNIPSEKRLEFRIGVNIGDVVHDGDRIYGCGVNIAARIEGIADPGGICISRNTYDHVKGKLDLGFEYLGEHVVKNIKEPVRVYKVLIEIAAPKPLIEEELELSDNPSIAVLPFDNMSGDSEQEYFSDGITEEIITALSKVPEMFVIARNSTFTYKGKPVKVQQVGEELGVQYVLEGSVRMAGRFVRITAQLVEAVTGHHLWAERYDRHLNDIFALQDEITFKILTALQVKLTEGEQARVWAKRTSNLDAFLKYLQARSFAGLLTEEGNIMARQLAQEAINLDKNYSDPYVLIAFTFWNDGRMSLSESRSESFKQAFQKVKKALALDDSNPGAHSILGGLYLYEKRYDQAIVEGEKALALGPNDAGIHVGLGNILRFVGKFEKAIVLINKAMRFNPIHASRYLSELAMCYYYVGRHEEAIKLAKKHFILADSKGENFISYYYYAILAMNYVRLGHIEKAQEAAAEVRRLFPDYSLEWDRKISVYKDPAHLERQHEDLRKAGFPEGA